jgi:hypothetical protein
MVARDPSELQKLVSHKDYWEMKPLARMSPFSRANGTSKLESDEALV